MHIEREGSTFHLFTSDPASGGEYIGSVPKVPGDPATVTSDELAKRLGVRWTPFDFDFAVMAGALGTYNLSRLVPKGATVLGGWYKVDTTFTDGGDDDTTISLGIEAAGDLVTAVSIATGTPWDAATPVQLLAGTKDTVTLTADRQVIAEIAVDDVTAGKLRGAIAWTFEAARAKDFTAA